MITTSTRKGRRIILRCLNMLRKGEGRNRHSGICGSVDDILRLDPLVPFGGVSYGDGDGMGLLFKGWKGGLHDKTAWPIDSEVKRLFDEEGRVTVGCGKWEGLKLELRLELIDHAIAKLCELGV